MLTWLKRFFTDEARFMDVAGRIGRRFPHYARFGVAFIGYLVQRGDIPTFVPGGGKKYGPLIMIAALLIRAGEFNNTKNPQSEIPN
jgi:hypothetical protein